MRAIFLDIETTGLDAKKHHAVEIAFIIVDLVHNKILDSYQSVVSISREDWDSRDPGSIEVNGFTWEKTQTGKDAAFVGGEIAALFTKWGIERGRAFFVCQNPSFDRAYFNQFVPVYTQEKRNWPYHWLDLASMYWARFVVKAQEENRALPREMNLSKNTIARSYNLPNEERPHQAMNGVKHLIQCYEAVFDLKFTN